MVRSIVNYLGRKSFASPALKAIPYGRYIATAKSAYSAYNKYKPQLRKAARMANALYKKRIARRVRFQKRRNFTIQDSHKPGEGSSKKHRQSSANFVNQQYQSRTLYTIRDICNVPRSVSSLGESSNSRQRLLINLRGFKYCFHVVNLIDQPIIFHFACVVKRHSQNDVDDRVDFYKNDGRANFSRGLNFNNSLSGMDHKCLNLNTDKYVVLQHLRIQIKPGAFGAPGPYNTLEPNFVTRAKYMRMNKQVRYDDNSSTSTYYPDVTFHHWADTCLSDYNSLAVEDVYKLSMTTITYFKEPKT